MLPMSHLVSPGIFQFHIVLVGSIHSHLLQRCRKKTVLPITTAELMTNPVRTISNSSSLCKCASKQEFLADRHGLNVKLNLLVVRWFQSPVPSLWVYKYPQTFADDSVNKR